MSETKPASSRGGIFLAVYIPAAILYVCVLDVIIQLYDAYFLEEMLYCLLVPVLYAGLTHSRRVFLTALVLANGLAWVALTPWNESIDSQVLVSLAIIVAVELVRRMSVQRAQMQDALSKSEESEREFQKRLRTLLEVGNELSTAPTLDDLCRQAVELGRSRLGFDRLGIWLVDESDPALLVGTFGTDGQGETRDERSHRLRVSDDMIEQHILSHRSHIEQFDEKSWKNFVVETGARCGVITGLWDAEGPIGLVSMDNLLRQRPVTARDCDLLSLYASTVAHLYSIKRADEVLQEREERYRSLTDDVLDSSAVGIFILDADFRIVWVNQATERYFGLHRQEIIGMDKRALIREHLREMIEDSQAFVGKLFAIYDSNSDVDKFECHVLPGDEREERWLEHRCRPIRTGLYAGGRIEHYYDITDRRRAEEDKDKLQEQLRQAQKMEAVGQLAGGVAHDFNNLLHAILGYTEMGMDGLSAGEQRYRDLEQVMKAGERAATLTRHLLAFSRRQVLQPACLDLNQLISDLMRMLHRVIGEHIELDLKRGEGLWTVRVDPGMIEQVLMNLCVNARDAMPDGGRIALETNNAEIESAFCSVHPWAREGEYVRLSVTDSGTGISPELLEHIFEPFFTTKEVGKGTGLGLSMVYGIVRQHEGLIHADSEIGRGTRFDIYVPKVTGEAHVEDRETAGAVPRGSETILIAEDEEMVLDIAVRAMEESGYKVLAARDGDEAVRAFEANADSIDIAVLDVVMPKLSGTGVYERIMARKPNLPVLFSSGYNPKAEFAGRDLREGAHLMRKPYTPRILLQRIREVLDAE